MGGGKINFLIKLFISFPFGVGETLVVCNETFLCITSFCRISRASASRYCFCSDSLRGRVCVWCENRHMAYSLPQDQESGEKFAQFLYEARSLLGRTRA